jgi:hypothetical protein
MEVDRSKWVLDFENPWPLQEVKVGDARGLYLNATFAYSYLRNVKVVFPELITESGSYSLLLHTVCPQNYSARKYKIYSHKRGARKVHFIIIPKHLRSAILRGKKRAMYTMKVFLDNNAHTVIEIELYGGI